MVRQAQPGQKIILSSNTKIETDSKNPTFFPRIVNKTDISFSNEELGLLNKGLKYNLEHKHKYWINKLAVEAENMVTLLPPGEQEYIRYQIAKNIKKTLNKAEPTQWTKFQKGKRRTKNHKSN